jgi:hypothetical protein
MSTLSSLALQKVPLEAIIHLGLEVLPTDDDFLSSLAMKISPQTANYYKENGWYKFRDDLIFFLEHERRPITYVGFTFYWLRWNKGYLLISAKVRDKTVNHFYYQTLEEILGKIFDTLFEIEESPELGEPFMDYSFEPKIRQVLEFMAEKNHDFVEELFFYLKNGSSIEITKDFGKLSIHPFSEIISARIILVENRLVVIGFLRGEVTTPENPGETDIIPPMPYITQFSGKDVKLALSIFAYNSDAYQVADFFTKIP